jgi:hypothetical protein
MYSDNIIDDVKINNINESEEIINISNNNTEETKNIYNKNNKFIKSFYKYTLAFLVFTSWVYGIMLVSLYKKTDHNIHSLTWVPFLLGSYINMLLFGFCYFIGDY